MARFVFCAATAQMSEIATSFIIFFLLYSIYSLSGIEKECIAAI